jgi:DNA-binding NarL/FixJ family response regulator
VSGRQRVVRKNKAISRIRVAIIEDDPLRVAGFHAILDHYADLQISAVSLSELANAYPTDVVVLRERCPGFAITMERARLVRPKVPIVVIAHTMSEELILDALLRGARGCIEENAALDDFVRAIRIVHEGLVWAPRSVLAAFIERYGRDDDQLRGPLHLTFREKQVLELLVSGMSNREIAQPLGIEVRTVKAHISPLMRKLGVRNRIALSSHALKQPQLISSTVGGQARSETHDQR